MERSAGSLDRAPEKDLKHSQTGRHFNLNHHFIASGDRQGTMQEAVLDLHVFGEEPPVRDRSQELRKRRRQEVWEKEGLSNWKACRKLAHWNGIGRAGVWLRHLSVGTGGSLWDFKSVGGKFPMDFVLHSEGEMKARGVLRSSARALVSKPILVLKASEGPAGTLLSER